MAKRGRKKKGEFADLDQEFMDNLAAASEDEIRKKVTEIAMETEALRAAKAEDEDLKAARARLSEAGRVYSEQEKGSKLRLKFVRSILKGRGLTE